MSHHLHTSTNNESFETPGNPEHYYTYSSTADNRTSTNNNELSMNQSNQSTENSVAASNEIGAPVVFSCISCRSLLGDSYSWIDANTASILLQRCINISVSSQLELSNEGDDIGSTFNRLQCVQCGQSVGKIYRSTPPQLDEFRDRYSLYVDKITGYELGTADNISSKSHVSSWMNVNTKLMQISIKQQSQIDTLQSKQYELNHTIELLQKQYTQLAHRLKNAEVNECNDDVNKKYKVDKSNKKHKLSDATNTPNTHSNKPHILMS